MKKFCNSICRAVAGFSQRFFPCCYPPAALADLDPSRITIEIVSEVLRVSPRGARVICETAVRQGFFGRVGTDCYYLAENKSALAA